MSASYDRETGPKAARQPAGGNHRKPLTQWTSRWGLDIINKAGVHLLTGHAGKGQQFDWVFVAGLEEGILPDFRMTTRDEIAEEARVLSVMVSRARHGVIMCYSKDVPAASGKPWIRKPSRFLTQISTAAPLDIPGMVDWFKTADWDRIAER